MSAYRDVIEALITDLTANVAGATNWDFRRSEPFWYPADHQHCAIFFGGEQLSPAAIGGTQPEGSRNFAETYVLRYWEPATLDQSRLAADDADVNALEATYETVRDRLLVRANQAIGGVWRLWQSSGRMTVAGTIEGAVPSDLVRGFEIVLQGERARAVT